MGSLLFITFSFFPSTAVNSNGRNPAIHLCQQQYGNLTHRHRRAFAGGIGWGCPTAAFGVNPSYINSPALTNRRGVAAHQKSGFWQKPDFLAVYCLPSCEQWRLVTVHSPLPNPPGSSRVRRHFTHLNLREGERLQGKIELTIEQRAFTIFTNMIIQIYGLW